MRNLPVLELSYNLEEEVALIERVLSEVPLRKGEELAILEAGCGMRWHLQLKGIPFKLTGVDVSQIAIERRMLVEKDLDEALVGDLRDIEFGPESFDVIYSAYVLEHINRTERVLDNFAYWLKQGGILVLRVPDPASVAGFITRITPHWFHILVYRHLYGVRNAGKAGFGPYRTYYDPVISRAGIRHFYISRGFEVIAERGDGYHCHDVKGRLERVINNILMMLSFLSLGRLSSSHAGLLYILRKK